MKKFELIDTNGGIKVLVTFGADGAADYVCNYDRFADADIFADVDRIRNGADPVADSWDFGSFEYDVDPVAVYSELEDMVVNKTAEVVACTEKWYAVMDSTEDDWGTGSFVYSVACDMLKKQGHGLIATIENDTECVDEIQYDDLF